MNTHHFYVLFRPLFNCSAATLCWFTTHNPKNTPWSYWDLKFVVIKWQNVTKQKKNFFKELYLFSRLPVRVLNLNSVVFVCCPGWKSNLQKCCHNCGQSEIRGQMMAPGALPELWHQLCNSRSHTPAGPEGASGGKFVRSSSLLHHSIVSLGHRVLFVVTNTYNLYPMCRILDVQYAVSVHTSKRRVLFSADGPVRFGASGFRKTSPARAS